MLKTRRSVLKESVALTGAIAIPVESFSKTVPTHDKRLWYRQPAQKWVEALPVGNGRIGAMIFGGTVQERLQLNEDTLWNGGPYDPVNPQAKANLPDVRRLIFADRWAEAQALANKKVMATPLHQMNYQTVGDLLIDMPGISSGTDAYLRELDLDAAIARTRFTVNGVTFLREVVASPMDQVIAIRLSTDRPGSINCDLSLKSPQPQAHAIATRRSLILSGRNSDQEGVKGALTFVAHLEAAAVNGRIHPDGDRLSVRGADSVTLLLAMATSYRRFDDTGGNPAAIAAGQVARACGKSFDRIASDTAAAHRRLFRRIELDLGRTSAADRPTDQRIAMSESSDDPALAALYFDYGRYLLICSSRPGSQPANLQGIWNDSTNPPWGSKYTININTEMNYWPAEPLALGECVEPLIAMVRDLAVTGARTARTMYGARGWVVHHNTDLWRATAPIDGAQWGLWPTGGAWLCMHLWYHYDYGRNAEYLKSIYPLLRGACQFFLDTLMHDPRTGYLVTNPSLSPENVHPHNASICAGPTMDMQILRDLFDRTARAASILKTDSGFATRLWTTRKKLAPNKIGSEGQLQEWQFDWDAQAPEPHHRHVSHLYGLFPSDQINMEDTPKLVAAARKSLIMRGDESTGWATAWRANLWARLREGDHAHRILAFLLGPDRTYPNMFDAHPPFQIDGNFGGTRAIAEMLIQARDDHIRLLPALPRIWPRGSISGLRAPGRTRIDLSWGAGQLIEAHLTSDLPGMRTVWLGDHRVEVQLSPDRTARLRGPQLVEV
ncbi:glycoside hydrolase family 95 protein [Stakelama sediminis]|nr:glycoside hydrolase family 95 protein [Stakelama sediminis]